MKILIPIKTYSSNSFLTLIMNNILTELRKNMSVEEFWFVYTKGEKNNENEVLHIDNFDNAKKVLEKIKPDLIHVWPTYTPIDYSFTLAAKKLNIPIIGGFHQPFANETASINSYFNLMFDRELLTDDVNSEKKFMKRGKFFIFKLLFLLKTQIYLKRNPIKILADFLTIFREIIKHETTPINSRFAVSKHWVAGEGLVKHLIKAKFKKETIVLTGNPLYDDIINKASSLKPSLKKDNKIRVLFAPSTPAEHGFTSKKEQDIAMLEIIKNIVKRKSEFSLVVKIHPSSAIYSEYKELTDKIDPNLILRQEGDFLDYLNDSDILITYPDTSLLPIPLLMKKPIIINNFYNAKNSVFLNDKLAHECVDASKITSQIIEIISAKNKIEDKSEKFVKDYLFKADGLASKRISDMMLNLIKNNPQK